MTRRYCVLGDPVAGSLSPFIFGRAFAARGIDAVYTARRVTRGGLPETLADLRDLVGQFLDPAGEIAHLLLEPVHADLGIDQPAAAFGTGGRRRQAAIDLALQHVEVAFQAVQTFIGRSVLAVYRRGRDAHAAPQGDNGKTIRQELPEHANWPRHERGATRPAVRRVAGRHPDQYRAFWAK